MYSSPLKSAGALWRSERIHLTDISRAPDNGIVRCDSRWNRQENDNRMHKLPNMESCRRCCVDAGKLSSCCVENMSEAMFSPIRSFSNDGSDFSDASLSVACSTSATSGQYQTVNNACPDGCCLECINKTARSSPQRRRRRKIVSRSLVLEPGVDGFPKSSRRPSSGRSDSSILARGEHCQDDSESSSSNYSTTAVKGVRRKPKSHRRCIPPLPYCRIGYRNPVIAPRPVYANCYSSLPWVPVHSEDIGSLQKVQELESDKKSLLLQASVLADQVEAQADKISELERLLDQKKEELIHLEQSLHQEMLARSAVESSKLELMAELSNLRLRLTASERDKKENEVKCRKLESELHLLQARLFEQEAEHAALRGKLSQSGMPMLSGNQSIEVEKLKSVLDSVVSSDEKDQKIEDLRSSLNKYKKLQDIVHSNHSKKMADNSGSAHLYEDDFMSSSSISCDAKKFQRDLSNMNTPQVPMSLASTSSIPSKFDHSVHCYYSTNLIKTLPSSSTFTSPFHKSNSVENICPASSQLHAYSSKSQYGTMPRQSGSEVLQQLQVSLCENEAEANERLPMVEKSEFPANMNIMKMHNKSTKGTGGKSSGVSFGKGFFKLRSGKRSSSEPHLGDKENTDNSVLLPTQPFIIKSDKEKNKGFLKFFSKWKRSGSQNIDRIDGDFKRGGVRATAGPRLGWSRDLPNDPDIPFNRWSADMIVEWLHRLGLSMYISECKRWMCNGEMLIKATASDLEKELNMKNPLHKKKLLLAIKSSGLSNLPSAINALDYHWVVRWLDDVGLPQYKDAFTEARVDGRVLHCITVDDLMFLKVTSQLHHISIRCGIQLLREKGFDPHCLIRRSLPDESKVYTPELVALWSNHRVMEWLRTVDLSEYAPNLRGSGVHGALIVYEPKFNTNLFATLLNIPPTKTLLRRHLATHFKHIVGDDLMQVKREKETETPLSPSVKIKVMRKTQFALKKKRNKTDFENEDYVCPLDIPVATDAPKLSDGDKLVVRRNSDPSPHEQKHLDLKEETVERIGAVSKEISSLTTILQGENLNEAPTTIV